MLPIFAGVPCLDFCELFKDLLAELEARADAPDPSWLLVPAPEGEVLKKVEILQDAWCVRDIEEAKVWRNHDIAAAWWLNVSNDLQ